MAIGDGHIWSDGNSGTGCIIEAAPNEKAPTKAIEMNGNIQSHINKYIDTEYISPKAQLLYLYKMCYSKMNNKIEAKKYEKKFLLLVADKKTQDKIVKSLKVLFL